MDDGVHDDKGQKAKGRLDKRAGQRDDAIRAPAPSPGHQGYQRGRIDDIQLQGKCTVDSR